MRKRDEGKWDYGDTGDEWERGVPIVLDVPAVPPFFVPSALSTRGGENALMRLSIGEGVKTHVSNPPMTGV